jgi:hypothetical protein
MQDVGESCLMTSLTPSPVLMALVETFGSLPVVLIALPAGALADIVDLRRLLLPELVRPTDLSAAIHLRFLAAAKPIRQFQRDS